MIYAIVFTAKRLIGNAGFDEAMVMLIDSYGNRVMYDYYAIPAPEPEPNPEA